MASRSTSHSAVPGGSTRDARRSSTGTSESPWYIVLALGAAGLVAVVHLLRDAHNGLLWRHTVPPAAVALLQMFVLTLGYRRLRRQNRGRVVMFVAGAVVSTLLGALAFQLHTDLAFQTDLPRVFSHGIAVGLAVGAFWALVVLLPAVVRDANLRSLAAESALREAELVQLRSNLQPHFLLNTLHTIAALTVDEPLVARRLLAALGDLLRDALESAPEVRPLEADIHWLRRYAEILEVRHNGALRFEWDIAPETLSVPLPKLLIQPLLENAVKHGALRRTGGGIVMIRTRFIDKAVELVVEDNGPGIAPGTKEGLGLRIVRERVSLAHPSATLHIASSPEGSRATIHIPGPLESRS